MNNFETPTSDVEDHEDEQDASSEDREPILEAIEELREPIKKILSQLHEHIDNGDYRLLIGGDASGRVPSLIFNKVIKKIYEKRGFDIPKTLTTFIAGGIRNTDPQSKVEEIKDEIEKYYAEKNFTTEEEDPLGYKGRALIVEDTIWSGGSITPVMEALKELNIEFDIATIAASEIFSPEIEEVWKTKIFSAQKNTPEIYIQKRLSGVWKKRGTLHSEARPSENSNKARRDAYSIADEITEWYLSEFPENTRNTA